MDELSQQLGGLPAWAQLLALLVLGAVGIYAGRRGRASRNRKGGEAPSGAKSSTGGAPSARTGARATLEPMPRAPGGQGARGRQGADGSSRESDRAFDSPGQFGDDATRDLDAAEIRALRPAYAPEIDGEPDPGEVVWTWVPYVENNGQGKDRPVLIIARIDEANFAACYLSTKEHRGFVSVGTGGWDSQGRESFLSPERVLRVHRDGMRREGQVLAKDRFVRAVQVVAAAHGIGR